MTELAQAALAYTAEGYYVLPLEPKGKRPLWGLSWEQASNDPEQVAEWWEASPFANVGIACVGDTMVLDVDGAEGERTLAELVAQHGPLPPTREVRTGRGRHLYFQAPPGQRPDGWRYGGLELKSAGYVVAPPSWHPSGALYEEL